MVHTGGCISTPLTSFICSRRSSTGSPRAFGTAAVGRPAMRMDGIRRKDDIRSASISLASTRRASRSLWTAVYFPVSAKRAERVRRGRERLLDPRAVHDERSSRHIAGLLRLCWPVVKNSSGDLVGGGGQWHGVVVVGTKLPLLAGEGRLGACPALQINVWKWFCFAP